LESAPEPGQTKGRLRLGQADLFILFLYLFAGYPIPQILYFFTGSSSTHIINQECSSSWASDGCSGHRWYLEMILFARLAIWIAQLLRIPGWLQVLGHLALVMFGPNSGGDFCATSAPEWFRWLSAWVFGLRSAEIGKAAENCPIYWDWLWWYVVWYVAAFHFVQPCKAFVTRLISGRFNGPCWAVVACGASVMTGASMAAFHGFTIILEDGKGFKWQLLPLEIIANIAQPVLLFLAMHWLPFDLSYWGNGTLGTYIFHFYVWEKMGGTWLPNTLKALQPAGGLVQVIVLLAIPFAISSVLAPVGTAVLTAPNTMYRLCRRLYSKRQADSICSTC